MQELTKEQIQAQLEKMEQDLPSKGSTSKLSDEDKAIARLVNKGQEDSGFIGSGESNVYHIRYKGKLAGKITRQPQDGKSKVWSGSHTDVKGIRQDVAVAQIKFLQSKKILSK